MDIDGQEFDSLIRLYHFFRVSNVIVTVGVFESTPLKLVPGHQVIHERRLQNSIRSSGKKIE